MDMTSPVSELSGLHVLIYKFQDMLPHSESEIMDMKILHMQEERCKNIRVYYLPLKLRVPYLSDHERCLESLLKIQNSGALLRHTELESLEVRPGFLQFYSFLNNSDAYLGLGFTCQSLNFLNRNCVSQYFEISTPSTQYLYNPIMYKFTKGTLCQTVLANEETQHNPGLHLTYML